MADTKHKKTLIFVRDGKDWFGCHLPEPVTGNLTDPKLCGLRSPVACKTCELEYFGRQLEYIGIETNPLSS